ncbi:MAG: alcohol dehydrogenase catalytic domain-containing protein [Spirochaetes bacterium]|nr:alcohol dehydrogenase catalytic domain-containing protein [Spirochaetota bacterium]
MRTIYFEVSIPKILLTKLLAPVFSGVYFSPLSPVRYDKLPDQPLPGENWVRVKNRLAGICGADMALFFVHAHPKITLAALPGVPRAFMGHELVGEVVETGRGVKDLKPGQRVVLQKYLPCCSMKEIHPPCPHCREGNYTLCENFSEGAALPANTGAGFGDHFLAHRSQLIRVPDSISDGAAVMLEPASVSLHAVLKSPPSRGDRVLVIGAGVIGQNVIQFARAFQPNCAIHVLEKVPFKKELALSMGADLVLEGDPYEAVARTTGGHLYRAPLGNSTIVGGYDRVFDCVGYSATIHDGLRWLKAGGDYVLIGNSLAPVSFDLTPVWQQELRMIGVNAHGSETIGGKKMSSFEAVMDLYARKKIRLEEFITHRFPIKEYKRAFRTIRGGREKIVKAVFEMD